MKNTVVCLTGKPQAGKTTFSKLLAQHSGQQRGACSDIIYPMLRSLQDDLPDAEDWHTTVEAGSAEQAELRKQLVKLGNAVSDQVPSIFPMALYQKGCRIIDGVRREEELLEFAAFCEKTGVNLVVVWIDRVNHPNPDIDDNTELTAVHANCVIQAETIEQLSSIARYMAANLFEEDADTEYVKCGVADNFETSFNDLCRDIHATAIAKGWWEAPRSDAEMICLVHSELSEAIEALRMGNPPDDKIPEFSGAEAELADTIIRIMDMSHARGWKVAKALLAKVRYNKTRAYKHGGKQF